jgi:tetratricopeptide (TPR) repeat protein
MKTFGFKIFIVVLVALSGGIIIYSCNKSKLDLLPHGPTEQSYFTKEDDFNKAVLGVYAKMTDFFWYNGGQYNTTIPAFLLPGDDITTNNGNEEFEQFGSLQPSSGRLSYLYGAHYQMVARANAVLQKIKEVGSKVYTTPNLKNYNEGEALFLRGYAYYNLWNFFGTSPLDTVRVTTTSQFTPAGTTATQLLDQAIADFTAAAGLLPATWDAANKGRATANSANGMLVKCLVFRASAIKTTKDYTAAIATFNKITGAGLVVNYDDNFAFDTENNSESLFEFQASQAFGGDNVWLSNDFDNAVGALSIYKYVIRTKLDQPGASSVNNYRILRYADVLLLDAEAILQSGGSTAEAIGLINQVRTRARNMTAGGTSPANYSTMETDKNKIMQWIMNERFLELSGEGQRWFDLRRWQMQGIITLDNSFFSSNTNMSFQLPKHLYFPIPNSELDVNPNVKQNTGY